MATFFEDGDPACNANNWNESGNPLSFNPYLLNVTNWIESYLALGAKSAVLTAKHGCGFCLWPTNVLLPNGTRYWYSVAYSSIPTRNVIAEFVDACNNAGIGHGFYYSLTNNFFLNEKSHYVQNATILPGQYKVTQAQWTQIALAQLKELFTEYGQFAEFWFDGGTGDHNVNFWFFF